MELVLIGSLWGGFLMGLIAGMLLYKFSIFKVELCFYPNFNPPIVLAYTPEPAQQGDRIGMAIVSVPVGDAHPVQAQAAYIKIKNIMAESRP